MKQVLSFILLIATLQTSAQQVTPTMQTRVHDPVMIKQADTYYVFCTGLGISVFSSKDLKNWTAEKPVFTKPPAWAVNTVPGFKGHIWAPDISFHNGLYILYYSVSAFGKNTSCIGVAVNKSLDPSSPDFKWEDKGLLLQSVPNRDMWNAIDPNLAIDEDGTPWLSFGSFWNGIKLVKLNRDFITIAQPATWHSLGQRKRESTTPDSLAGNGAIEAPFIFRKNNFYYLFISVDYCCRAEKSDYKIVVGRANKIAGPYLDKNRKDLLQGGGTLVRQGDKNWYGAGHNAAYEFNGRDYLIYHGYDAGDKGRSKLIIEEMEWTADGWPVEKPIPSGNRMSLK